MTTVSAVRRALEETQVEIDRIKATRQPAATTIDQLALKTLLASPVATTLLANRLSDRGDAGNEAARRNLGDLKRIAADLRFTAERVGAPGCSVRLEAADKLAALEWAIDQLTPPELANPQERCDLGVGCDETGHCFAEANGQPERCGRKS